MKQRHSAISRPSPQSVALALILGTAVIGLSGGCSSDSEPRPHVSAAGAGGENHCLALSMYWEAKAEGRAGMRAVGHVIMNRIADPRFPNTACAVVRQGGAKPPCQFSWYCDGKSDKPTERRHWADAQDLAADLLEADPREIRRRDPTRGALFFHAKRLKNPWRVKRDKTVVIGRHVFYR